MDYPFYARNGLIANGVFTANSTQVTIPTTATLIANGSAGSNGGILTTNSTGTFWSFSANNALNLGGTSAASYQLNSTLAANVINMASNTAGTANNALYLGGTVASSFVINNYSTGVSLGTYGSANPGISGYSNNNSGISGFSNSSMGIYGLSNSNIGVYGVSNTGTAGFFQSSTNNIVVFANSLGGGSFIDNSGVFHGTANNSTYLGGTSAASYQLNSTLAANVASMNANNASYLGGIVASSYITNVSSSAVGSAIAGLSSTSIGQHIIGASYIGSPQYPGFGGTVAGSTLAYDSGAGFLSGTWLALGETGANGTGSFSSINTALWVRIS
jgi:hypothetical protein